MVVESALQLLSLRVGQGDLLRRRRNAVPDLLNQREAVLDTEPINPERLHGGGHRTTSVPGLASLPVAYHAAAFGGPNATEMRLFLALDLPADAKHRLSDGVWSRRDWWGADAAAHLRRVPAENLHVTLKFLGEVPDDRAADVRAAVAAGLPRVGPLELRPAAAGFFPPRGPARVFVVHLTGDVERLAQAYAGIEAALEPLGFPREGRAFKPHVTLGRARDRRGAPRAVRVPVEQDPDLPGEPFRVDAVTLFRSDLRPAGPVYTGVELFPL